jgi:hypothetical protein
VNSYIGRTFIPRQFVCGQSIVKDTVTRETCTQRFHERFGVNERITDALCGDRIPVVAGIADERPSLAIRFAEVSGHARRAVPLSLAAAFAYAGEEIWRCFERAPDVPVDVAADGRKVLGWPVHHHEVEAVVRRRAAKGDVVSWVELDVVLSDAVKYE